MARAKKEKEYFKVPHDCYGQHGDTIIPITKEEYERAKACPHEYAWYAAYFDSYASAIYYTLD